MTGQPGGTAYRSIFRTVSRASPNCRAASRSLILSTTAARRTRAYNSTVYTSPAFHKHVANVRRNQFPGGLLSFRRNAAHAASTGPFCIRRLNGKLDSNMTRRELLATTITAGAASSSASAATPSKSSYYELRYYRMRTDRTEQNRRTTGFLTKTYLPAAKSAGAGPVGLFSSEIAPNSPFVLCLTSFPSWAAMESVRERLAADDYQKALAEYNSGEPGFQRIESWILRAFDFFPAIEIPAGDVQRPARIFELRTYESLNESTLRQKIKMFGAGEIDAFRQSGITPLMFGESIAGTNMPHISYMVSFENLAVRAKNRATFGANPIWQKLRTSPEYATPSLVVNISNSILNPIAGSDIR